MFVGLACMLCAGVAAAEQGLDLPAVSIPGAMLHRPSARYKASTRRMMVS
jgi:hypothetical protein